MPAPRRYRSNLPPPEDTSTGAPDLLTPGFLRYVGELLYGTKWQSPLADCLSQIRGKDLSPATVHRWTTSSRSIPDWVQGALQIALDRAHHDLDRRAQLARTIAERIHRSPARRKDYNMVAHGAPHQADL